MMVSLYFWMVIATPHYRVDIFGWQHMGDFQSSQACHAAAVTLNMDTEKHRCVSKNTGEQK